MVVFTTGQVAKICKVSQKTVGQWFDKHLLAGYQLPGSTDRRITQTSLLAFMREHGFPLEQLEWTKVLVVTSDKAFAEGVLKYHVAFSFEIIVVGNAFDAGKHIGEQQFSCVVVDTSIGRPNALDICGGLREDEKSVQTAIIGVTQGQESEIASSYVQDNFHKPFDAALLVSRIRSLAVTKEKAA